MENEIRCVYCGHPNPADKLFCEDCSRVLDDPETLENQQRKIYLDQENALITETSAFIYGKTYPISEISEVEVLERMKDRRFWGLGMIIFGIGTLIEGLFEGELEFSIICGLPILLVGVLIYAVTKPKKEKLVPNLWITTEDGEEHSLPLEDEAEAEAIKDALLQSCSDRGEKAQNTL